MVNAIKDAERALEDGISIPTEDEEEIKKNIERNEIIGWEMIGRKPYQKTSYFRTSEISREGK